MVLEKLLDKFQVHIKSEIPDSYFHIYLKGNFSTTQTPVDVGCVQKDFIRIDIDKTLQKLETFLSQSGKRIEEEMQWLKENKIDLVISDASSLPLKAANETGIPSILISNFTWHDIYNFFPEAAKQKTLLDILQNEYAAASLQILPQCHIFNDIVAKKEEVGFIARKGQNVRDRLETTTETSFEDKTVVFIYLGDIGAQAVQWKNLINLRDCLFITRDPLPKGIANLFVLDDRFLYQDLIASSDIVCTKAGYSTLATAFSHGKPVISCSREYFREFEAMQDYMFGNKVGLIVDSKKFFDCDWEEDIQKAQKLSIEGKVPLDGEVKALKIIDRVLQKY